ncbi:hypothetical protein GHK92_02585 [Nocardioides sp. dk4132]|nr:hypothetical protein [Nocardioides sp. dk4132]QGA09552.1 hypothetical protein GFH29_04025 [Nocardioides sp. dk884]
MGTYDVVLLVEQALSASDAAQVHSLHDTIADQVVYHVLLPLEDAASRIETSLGTLGAGDMMASPAMAMEDIDLDAVREDCRDRASEDLQRTLTALRATGAQASGEVTAAPPVDALAAKVEAVGAAEAIILTRPHLVAEFFHVDWSSRARRRLGVPVLHLLERETFDEQAGGGEGVTGV